MKKIFVAILFLFCFSGCTWLAMMDTNPEDDKDPTFDDYRKNLIRNISDTVLGKNKSVVLNYLKKPESTGINMTRNLFHGELGFCRYEIKNIFLDKKDALDLLLQEKCLKEENIYRYSIVRPQTCFQDVLRERYPDVLERLEETIEAKAGHIIVFQRGGRCRALDCGVPNVDESWGYPVKRFHWPYYSSFGFVVHFYQGRVVAVE
jgi:hypothetical protein